MHLTINIFMVLNESLEGHGGIPGVVLLIEATSRVLRLLILG